MLRRAGRLADDAHYAAGKVVLARHLKRLRPIRLLFQFQVPAEARLQASMNSATPSPCIQAGRRTPPEWGRPVLLRPRGVPRAELLSPRLLLPWLRDVLAPLDTHSPRHTPAAMAHTVLSSLLPLSVSVQARSIGRPCGRNWLGSMACVQDSYSGVPLAQLGESVGPRRVWQHPPQGLGWVLRQVAQLHGPREAVLDPAAGLRRPAGPPLARQCWCAAGACLGPPRPCAGTLRRAQPGRRTGWERERQRGAHAAWAGPWVARLRPPNQGVLWSGRAPAGPCRAPALARAQALTLWCRGACMRCPARCLACRVLQRSLQPAAKAGCLLAVTFQAMLCLGEHCQPTMRMLSKQACTHPESKCGMISTSCNQMVAHIEHDTQGRI